LKAEGKFESICLGLLRDSRCRIDFPQFGFADKAQVQTKRRKRPFGCIGFYRLLS
jgi:hypothetical protein